MTTTRRLSAAMTAAAVLGLAACGAIGGEPEDGPSPEAAVQEFLDLRIEDDCEAYREYYSPEYAAGSGCYEAPLVEIDGYPRVDGATTDGDSSVVETTDLFECDGPGKGDPVEMTVEYLMVRADGEWLIDDVEYESTTDDDCIAQNDD